MDQQHRAGVANKMSVTLGTRLLFGHVMNGSYALYWVLQKCPVKTEKGSLTHHCVDKF